VGLEGVVDAQILGVAAGVSDHVAEGPDAVIRLYGVVSEVEEGLCAHVAAEDGVALVFDVVLFVVFFVRVYLSVCEVETKVEEILVLLEIVLDFLWGGAGPRGVCIVVAG